MASISGLSYGTAAVVVSGLAAAVVMARTCVHLRPPARRAYWLIAAGLLAASAGAAVAAGSGGDTGRGTAWLLPLAVSLSVYGVVALVGVLMLPGGDEPTGSALRRGTDGLLIAACTLYVAWSVFLGPHRLAYLGRPLSSGSKILGVVLVSPSVVVVGVCLTILYGVRRTRPRLAIAAASLAATVTCGAELLVTAGHGSTPVVTAIAVAYAGGLFGTALAARGAQRAAVVAAQPPRYGTLLAWLPVSGAIAACVIHLVIYHSADNMSIVIAAVIGAALSGRQTLAMREIRAYAEGVTQREARFREMAHTDPLTGLANRRAFEQVLLHRVIGARPGVLLFIDLDGFKHINDLRGHDIGDAVLVEVGRRLRANVRPSDVAARLGGDEFAVLLWLHEDELNRDGLNRDEALVTAGRLRTVLAAPYVVGGVTVTLSASIGLAQSDRATDTGDLMRNADLALRFAKQHGKDRIEGYDAAYAQWLRRRTTIEEELAGAITRDELSVVYQPIVTLPAGRTVGAEAMMRWHHPVLGAVPPAEFIPIAEDCGIIDVLGRWMLQESCRQLSRWTGEGHDIWLAVNVSALELHQPAYLAQVAEITRGHRVPPARLVLEVAEHAVAVETAALAGPLTALREAGVRVALDRVGAGYSALGRLGDVPVDMLKIDRSIVAEPARDPGRPAGPIVDVLARLGTQLGLDVIAEGVVSPAHRQVVESAGCRYGQGDLFGKAMPAEHLEARLDAELGVPQPRRAAPSPASPVPTGTDRI